MNKIYFTLACALILISESSAQATALHDTNNNSSLYDNRYIITPSAFGLNKGAIQYSNHTIFFQDVQYGVFDRMELSFGSSFFLAPVYLFVTYKHPINAKSAFAIGDIAISGLGLNFLGNLLYGMYTRGNSDNNFSLGVGLWASSAGKNKIERIEPTRHPPFNEYRIKMNTTSPTANFSALLKISNNLYFITENFGFKQKIDAIADLKEQNPDGSYDSSITSRSQHYGLEATILSGIIGFRYISKRQPLNFWHFSVIYILNHKEDIPIKYSQNGWETNEYKDFWVFLSGSKTKLFIPIPLISYSRRLGK